MDAWKPTPAQASLEKLMLNTLFLLFCPTLSVYLRTRVCPDTGDVKPSSSNSKHTQQIHKSLM